MEEKACCLRIHSQGLRMRKGEVLAIKDEL